MKYVGEKMRINIAVTSIEALLQTLYDNDDATEAERELLIKMTAQNIVQLTERIELRSKETFEEDKVTVNAEPGGIYIIGHSDPEIMEFNTTIGYVKKIKKFLKERDISRIDSFIHEAIRLHMFRYEIEEGKHGDFKWIVEAKKKD